MVCSTAQSLNPYDRLAISVLGPDQVPEPDFRGLGDALKTIAHGTRLELLSLLRTPRTLEEILLTPGASQAREQPDRPISRQAVQFHLVPLVRKGLVREQTRQRKGARPVREYVVDSARVYALVEEFRQVSTLQSLVRLEPGATFAVGRSQREPWEDGPKLVLVHGVHEGKAFPLRKNSLRPGRGWVLGRKAGVQVPLEYDPFVSSENSEVIPGPEGFRLLDLRTARNGTFLNWQRLPIGGDVPLRHGNVVGVGRSLLLFLED